jgi:hypothetical protein
VVEKGASGPTDKRRAVAGGDDRGGRAAVVGWDAMDTRALGPVAQMGEADQANNSRRGCQIVIKL